MITPSEAGINDITRVIQLAIAPVFMLNAVGAIMGVLANRLSRIVDRMRALEEPGRNEPARDPGLTMAELAVLERRMRLVYIAIGLAVICALFVGSLIAIAFVDAFLKVDLSALVALLFIAAMLAFIGSLLGFLREIFLAVKRFTGIQVVQRND
jgi:Protein of unknown function (DUF2721)